MHDSIGSAVRYFYRTMYTYATVAVAALETSFPRQAFAEALPAGCVEVFEAQVEAPEAERVGAD